MQWKLIAGLLMVLCCGWAGAQGDQDATLAEREPAAGAVMQRIEAGDPAGALELAEALVEAKPERSTSYITRARARVAGGDVPGAMADLGKALELAPIDVHAAMELSFLQAQAGDIEGAWQTLKEPTWRRPTSTLLKLARVDVLIAEGKLAEADAAMAAARGNHAARGHPRFVLDPMAAAYDRLAMAHLDAGDSAAAIMRLGFARSMWSSRTHVYALRLGELQLEAGQLDGALSLFKELAQDKRITEDAALTERLEAGSARLEAALAERQATRAAGEEAAAALIPLIDAYRRNPSSLETRKAVIDAVEPLYAELFHSPSVEMLLPLLEQAPEGLVEPADLAEARDRAFKLYQQFNPGGMFASRDVAGFLKASDRVLRVYPYPLLIRLLVTNGLNAGESPVAYETAILGEAVIFAEYYYARRANAVSEYGTYQMMRRLGMLALASSGLEQPRPDQAPICRVLELQEDEQWIEADNLRNELLESLAGPDKAAYSGLLNRAWEVDRGWLEKAYHDAYQAAVERDDVAEQDRIARYMFEQQVVDQRFGGLLLNHISNNGEPGEFERCFQQLMQQDPYHIYALYMASLHASGQNKDMERLLYTNAVVQFIEEAGSPRQLQGILTTSREVLARLEPSLQPDTANGYWNAARAFEQQAMEKRQPTSTYQPVVEAAAIRILELAPNNPPIMGMVASLRLGLGNYQGSIAAAELAIKMDPTTTGQQMLIIGDAYRQMLPATTLDRDGLKANYLKAIDAFNQAIELGAFNNAGLLYKFQGDMYEVMEMIDPALERYQKVIEVATVVQQRGYAYYKIAKLKHEHDKAERDQIVADLEQAIQVYTDAPPVTLEDRAASANAVLLLDKLTR